MSEKIYVRLFRLYPSKFCKKYESEALQLIRDRLRDEAGFFKRARLWWDLVADLFAGLAQAYRNSYPVTEAASLIPDADGIPSFKVLEEEPLGRGSILLGGTLSVSAMVAFASLLTLSINRLPVPASIGRLSPIEAVVERLNRIPTPDTPIARAEEPSRSSAVRPAERQQQSGPALDERPSKAPVLLAESTNDVDKRKQIVLPAAENATKQAQYATVPSALHDAIAWSGALTDASGRAVSLAEVHLIGGHGELVARTAADGSFSFSEVPSGTYEVTVVLGGREVAYRKALYLSAASVPGRLTLAGGGHLLISGAVR